MPSFRTCRVVEVLAQRPGIQRLRLHDDSRAYVLTGQVGTVSVDDEVVVNTTAVDLGLGTGGWHVVHWNLSRRELHQPGPGHIMKVRYTSLQTDTGVAEEVSGLLDPAVPFLDGVPVLVGSLHSQLGVVAAVLHHARPDLRVSYVMTDGASLPLALSDLVASLRDRDLICGTVTAGHAFGGDHEAVGVPSALQIAVEVHHADIVVCAMGPGVVGTGTALGTTALEVASIAASAAMLGAHPVVIARASSGDVRPRHQGISHHTRTALALLDRPVDVPLPPELAGSAELGPHRVIEVDPGDVEAALAATGVRVTTMGRGFDADPLFFRAAAAAARHALVVGRHAAAATPTDGTVWPA